MHRMFAAELVTFSADFDACQATFKLFFLIFDRRGTEKIINIYVHSKLV